MKVPVPPDGAVDKVMFEGLLIPEQKLSSAQVTVP